MYDVITRFNNIINDLKLKKNYRTEKVVDINNFNILKTIFGIKEFKNFASNDYLGLSQHSGVKKAGIKAINDYGAGATSSKLITGYSVLYKKIEDVIKQHKKQEDCLIFTSGYTANLGIFESLFTSDDIIFLDENSHASSFAGAKLSGAKIMRYKHNSWQDLEDKINHFKEGIKGKIGIATEIVFSMQGTKLKSVPKYFEIAKKHNAILITDEAHSFGVFKTTFPAYELHLQMGTFSKSVGVLGGYVCGMGVLIDAIRQFAKSSIYTTALPPSVLASVFASLKLIFEGKVNGRQALLNARFFSKLTGIKVHSQIVFITTETNEKALYIAETLNNKGFIAKAIRRPTVKSAGVRLSFTNRHKKLDIARLSFILLEKIY